MKVEIKVPTMGESIAEATIGALLKANGSHVAVDDELIELETDKVNQVLYAQQAGVVTWNVDKEETVKIGQVLGFIDSDQVASTSTPPPPATSKKQATSKKNSPATALNDKSSEVKANPPASSKAVTEEVMPGARVTKEQFVVDLKREEPTQEPMIATETKASMPTKPSHSEISTSTRETRKKMSKIRMVIAGRLVDALQQTAMLTTFNEVDMSKIIALRDAYKEEFVKKHACKLGFMSFFIKAAVSALKAYPEVNTYIDGTDIVYRNYFDISIAVGTEKGVIVPVIRACDQLSFAEIENQLETYAKKAREGGLVPDDLQGGGFTITNGGVYGSLLSTPILNMPQSAILGMHKIVKRPVVVEDEIVIRPIMNLALSYDHRIVDGKEAVSFLVHIKNCLEDPSRLLLEV